MKSKELFDKFFYYVIIFFIASFIGYIYEVIYYLVEDNILVNRGFLYGPYLPVYGVGALIMIVILKRFKKHPVLLYFMATIVTGITEYITGVLLNIFGIKLWDYTGLFLNINGYVCLRSVLSFGVGALLLFYIAEPLIVKKIMPISNSTKKIITTVLLLTMITDFILTMVFKYMH